MNHTFTFTIKVGATLTRKATGETRINGTAQAATGELRGTGFYVVLPSGGAPWRVSAKDVTGLRRAA